MIVCRWHLISPGSPRPLHSCAPIVPLGPGQRRTAAPRCCIPRAAVLPAHFVDLGSISDDVRAQCSRGRQKRHPGHEMRPNHRPRTTSGHIWLKMVAVLARGRPPTGLMCASGVPGAWPTAYGPSQAPHPVRAQLGVRGRSSGNVMAQYCRGRRKRRPWHKMPPNHRYRPSSGHIWLFIVPVLARGRPPTGLLCSGSVPGAWRMVRGRSQALHPGRSRFPGPTRHPQQVFAQCGPGYRKRRTRDTKCVRIADLQIMAFSLPVMFGCHTRHFAISLPVMFGQG